MSTQTQADTAVMEAQKTKGAPQLPPQYKVILLNDDYTPMEFVIEILGAVFKKTLDEAVELTMAIHHEGKGLCGTYVKDMAEFKQAKVLNLARAAGHPLQCILEKVTPAPSPSSGKGPKP